MREHGYYWVNVTISTNPCNNVIMLYDDGKWFACGMEDTYEEDEIQIIQGPLKPIDHLIDH